MKSARKNQMNGEKLAFMFWPQATDENTPEALKEYENRWEALIAHLYLNTDNGLIALVERFARHIEPESPPFMHILDFAEDCVECSDYLATINHFNSHTGSRKPSLVRATRVDKPGCWFLFHRTKEMLKLLDVNRTTLSWHISQRKPHNNLIFTMEDPKPLLAHRDAVWTKAQIREQLNYTHEELGLE